MASFINYFNKTDFIIRYFIKYGGVFSGGDPAKRDEDHKIRSAPSGRDIQLWYDPGSEDYLSDAGSYEEHRGQSLIGMHQRNLVKC